MAKIIELQLQINDQQFNAKITNSDALIDSLNRKVKSVSDTMSNWGNIVTGFNQGLQVLERGYQFADKFIQKYEQQEMAEKKVQQAIISTGQAAGYSADELIQMATNLQKVTTFGDEKILNNATAQILTFTNITGENFKRTERAALDVATVLSTGPEDAASRLKDVSLQLGKALNDPIANMGALSRAGIQFSETQKETIKGLVQAGDLAKAQSIMLTEIERQYGGQAKAMAETATGQLVQVQNQLADSMEKIGKLGAEILLPFLSNASKAITTILDFIGVNEKQSESLQKSQIEFNALTNMLKESNNSQETRKRIIDELQSKYGSYLGNLKLEKASIEEITKAQELANKEFENKIKLAAAEEIYAQKMKELTSLEKELFETQLTYQKAVQTGEADKWIGGQLTGKTLGAKLQENIEDIKKNINIAKKDFTDFQKWMADQNLTPNENKTIVPPKTIPATLTTEQKKALQKLTDDRNKYLDDFSLQVEKENFIGEERNKTSEQLVNDYINEQMDLSNTIISISQATNKTDYDNLQVQKTNSENRIKVIEDEMKRRQELDDTDLLRKQAVENQRNQLIDEEYNASSENSLLQQVKSEEYIALVQMENDADEERMGIVDKMLNATTKSELDSLTKQKQVVDKKLELIKAEKDARVEATKSIIESGMSQYDAQLSLAANIGNVIRQEIKAYVSKAVAAALASAIASLPFPFDLIAAAAAGPAVEAIFEAVVPKFKEGGLIHGKLHSQGGEIAELEDEEFIINRKSSKKYRPLVEAINDDNQNKILSTLLNRNLISSFAGNIKRYEIGGVSTSYDTDINNYEEYLEKKKSLMDEEVYYETNKKETIDNINNEMLSNQKKTLDEIKDVNNELVETIENSIQYFNQLSEESNFTKLHNQWKDVPYDPLLGNWTPENVALYDYKFYTIDKFRQVEYVKPDSELWKDLDYYSNILKTIRKESEPNKYEVIKGYIDAIKEVIKLRQSGYKEIGGPIVGKLHSQGGELTELEDGEYVINRKSSKKYHSLIEAINKDSIGKSLSTILSDKFYSFDISKMETGGLINSSKISRDNLQLIDKVSGGSINISMSGFETIASEIRGLREDQKNQTDRLERVERVITLDPYRFHEEYNSFLQQQGKIA